MDMGGRRVCERCGHTWSGDEERCPKCLRKSSVRDVGRDSAAARLAAGDHSTTDQGRRAAALGLAVALTAAVCVSLAFRWAWLDELGLGIPALVAGAVAATTWFASALVPGAWRAIALRLAAGGVLGVWALVCAVLAQASGSASVPFVVLVGAVSFVGGLVPVLAWARRREEPTDTPPSRADGKWR